MALTGKTRGLNSPAVSKPNDACFPGGLSHRNWRNTPAFVDAVGLAMCALYISAVSIILYDEDTSNPSCEIMRPLRERGSDSNRCGADEGK